MVTDEQVKRLMKVKRDGKTQAVAAARAGMCAKTARRYLRAGTLPSQMKQPHPWRTREDPFAAVWPDMEELLRAAPTLEAKTLFEDLQRRSPGQFQDGQLRTLQRRVKAWRAQGGPEQEVFFDQVHEPGALSESDFTHATELGVTLEGQVFEHLVYHFVLPYSNWETGSVCFAESFESLAQGLSRALTQLGGVPVAHQTDRLTAAVVNLKDRDHFTQRYADLLHHYGLEGRRIQAGRANENGDVEQRHHRLKRALEQALLLRGSREFASREAYEQFLMELFARQNAGRRVRFEEERAVLRALPSRPYAAMQRILARVRHNSTLRVANAVYSVPSRLMGERVEVRLYAEHLEVWYAQREITRLPRLSGKGQAHIDYRHVIHALVRKPGAFAGYRYREALYPTSRFRMAYDSLLETQPSRADKEYLLILEWAATTNEAAVDAALAQLLQAGEAVSFAQVQARVKTATALPALPAAGVEAVALTAYDALLSGRAFV